MGGHGHDAHGHGHHHEPYHVPKPEFYANKADKIPELVMVKEELAKRGLKDPWLRLVIDSIYIIPTNRNTNRYLFTLFVIFLFDRNEVWRYDQKIWGNRRTRIFRFIFRGFPLGVAAFAATCGIEYSLGYYSNPHGGHGGHGEQGAHGTSSH